VEAENFDAGKNEFTYYDLDEKNLAGAYRPNEAVDIYDRNGKGYHVGNALPGEWLEYSLRIAATSRYKVEFFLASLQGNGTFQVKIGNVVSDTLKAPVTNSSLTTKSVSTVLKLDSGLQIMRFTILGHTAFNIDYFRFKALQTGITEQVHHPSGISGITYHPASARLTIRLADSKSIEKLFIYHISGRLMATLVIPDVETEMSVSGWAKGVYVVCGAGKNGRETKKIVIY